MNDEHRSDLLSRSAIQARLRTTELGVAIEVHRSVDSTNTVAKQRARAGAAHGTVILAEEQTAGRGRMQRSFFSPAGDGIYMSLIIRPDAQVADVAAVTVVAALAVADAIAALTDAKPRIKWPNDVLLDGRKVCGILTEAAVAAESGQAAYLVIGIGVNVHNRELPDELKSVAVSLQLASAGRVDRNALVAAILDAFAAHYATFRQSGDLSRLLPTYRARLAMLGQPIDVIRGEERYQATALDVDARGGLIVRRGDGTLTTLTSGEVSIRPSR
jgi:BirA family biotin operon repressor/biotin-[acetyl-CoA-carboxylase] ligase